MEQNTGKRRFDLADLDVVKVANAGTEVELLHPGSGEGLDIFVSIVGRDSDEFRKVNASIARRRISKMSKGGARNQQITADDLMAENVEMLAACTKGWRGMEENGVEVPFSVDEAERLYAKYPWMREQLDNAIGDRALFMKV